MVWARDDKTGEEGFKTVVETYVREADKLVHLTYQGEGGEATIVGTDEHPFWSITAQDWVNLGELRIGERLSLTAGPDACMSNCMAVVTGVLTENAVLAVSKAEVAERPSQSIGSAVT